MGLQSRGTTGRGIHRAQPGTADGVSLPPHGTGLAPQFWLPTRRVPAARPSGSLGRAAQSCAPQPVEPFTDRWRSTVVACAEDHFTLPRVLGVTACVPVPHRSLRSPMSYCSSASPPSIFLVCFAFAFSWHASSVAFCLSRFCASLGGIWLYVMKTCVPHLERVSRTLDIFPPAYPHPYVSECVACEFRIVPTFPFHPVWQRDT